MKLRDALAEAARTCIEAALAKHQRNVVHAARELGIHRSLVYKYAKLYGVTVRPARPSRVYRELSAWGRVQ